MITDAWNTQMRNLIYGDSTDLPSHVAMGTGTTAVANDDTTIETELYRKLIDARTKPGTSKVMFQGTLSAAEGNGSTFTECGAFNAASGVTMVNHQLHTGILKANTFELRYQIEIEFKDTD